MKRERECKVVGFFLFCFLGFFCVKISIITVSIILKFKLCLNENILQVIYKLKNTFQEQSGCKFEEYL